LAGYVTHMGRKGHAWKALVEKHEAKRRSGRRHHKRGYNIIPGIQEIIFHLNTKTELARSH